MIKNNLNFEAIDKWILKCPQCGAENNWHFVMYYGDVCFNCDFDIREHMRKEWGWYNKKKNMSTL